MTSLNIVVDRRLVARRAYQCPVHLKARYLIKRLLPPLWELGADAISLAS